MPSNYYVFLNKLNQSKMRNDNPLGQSLASKIENFSIQCGKTWEIYVKKFSQGCRMVSAITIGKCKEITYVYFLKKTSFVHEIIP